MSHSTTKEVDCSWSNLAESPSWKLASTLTTIGLAGLKYVIMLSLVLLAFSFSNASFSSAPHLNFVYIWISSCKGVVGEKKNLVFVLVVSDAFLWMNLRMGWDELSASLSEDVLFDSEADKMVSIYSLKLSLQVSVALLILP